MSFRVGQERGRKGWYVYVDRPKALRSRRGGKTARRKAGETREAALINALRIEAELIKQWTEEADQSPFKAAKEASTNLGIRLDVALDEALRGKNYKREDRERIVLGLEDPADLQKQGLEIKLSRTEQAQLEEIQSDTRPWQEWVEERRVLEDRAASTVVNWQTKLKGLANWYGSQVVGTMNRKDANAYKLHMAEKGMSSNSISNYLGTFSGFWNWAINSGELKVDNPWKELKRGLPVAKKRQALDPQQLHKAEQKADELKDVRFFFGRYQGLRKEDYCGLRWCDVDLQKELIHLRRYEWQGMRRNLKLKEAGERTIPIHSELTKRLSIMLPDVVKRNDQAPIWIDDYKAKLECWGATWAETFKYRYGFGTHDLRSYVVTQMMKCNINPFFLHAITGHRVPGTSAVVLGYVTPTIEEVRDVLELLK